MAIWTVNCWPGEMVDPFAGVGIKLLCAKTLKMQRATVATIPKAFIVGVVYVRIDREEK